MINRISYKNKTKKSNFEIVDLTLFFATRPHSLLKKDYRLNFWSLIFITEGTGIHSIDFVDYSYKKGDVLFIQKNQVNHFEVNLEVKGYIVHINEPFFYRIQGFNGDIFLEFMDRAFGSPILPFNYNSDSTNRILIDLIYKEYNRLEEGFNIGLIASLFQGLILSLREQLPQDSRILLSRDYENFKVFRQLVEQHYPTTRNVEEYAGMMHLSKKTINQATQRVANLSAKQFITNRLILEIKRYLSQGELLNYQIADILGFDEAANMTSFFTRYEGISPKDFKKNLIED